MPIAEHIPRAFRRSSKLVDLNEEKKVNNEYMIRGAPGNVKIDARGVSFTQQQNNQQFSDSNEGNIQPIHIMQNPIIQPDVFPNNQGFQPGFNDNGYESFHSQQNPNQPQGDPNLYKPPGVDAYDDLEKEFLMRTQYDITFNLKERGN